MIQPTEAEIAQTQRERERETDLLGGAERGERRQVMEIKVDIRGRGRCMYNYILYIYI